MSEKNRRILLGRITAPHGIRGDVLVHSYTQEPQDVAAYGPLETQDGKRLEINVVRVGPKGVIAHVAGISNRTEAEALKGSSLYVDRGLLPKTKSNEFYHADLVGLPARDRDGRQIGTVVAVENYGAGDLLELRLTDTNRTELIPFTETFVPVVDLVGGHLVVVMPTEESSDD